jgi:hypothetical protein
MATKLIKRVQVHFFKKSFGKTDFHAYLLSWNAFSSGSFPAKTTRIITVAATPVLLVIQKKRSIFLPESSNKRHTK